MDNPEPKFPYSPGDPVHVKIDVEVSTTWEDGEAMAKALMDKAQELGCKRVVSGVKYAKPEELEPVFWYPEELDEEDEQPDMVEKTRTLQCPYCGQQVAVNDTDTAIAHWSNGELCKGAGKRMKR